MAAGRLRPATGRLQDHVLAPQYLGHTRTRVRAWQGYCEQQVLALNAIYDALGIQTRPVFAVCCAFPAKMVDGVWWPGGVSGHTWLRVRIGGEERDVCPGSVENTPGRTQFQVLSPVRAWSPWLRPFTHLGSSLENMRRDMVAQRAGAAPSPAIKAGGQQ